ncbi:MAG: hypothetical protein K1X55_15980 [Chitinophagales bacterium]|nr:hypothetical protein [Chitinophagales bacterium]
MSQRKVLTAIANKVFNGVDISPDEVEQLLSFDILTPEENFIKRLTLVTVPMALVLGFTIAAFPTFYESIVLSLPNWTNLSDSTLAGVDYLWEIFTDPVGKKNIIYHIPNIVLHSFGILGLQKVWEYIRNKTWRDKVMAARSTVKEQIEKGEFSFQLKQGHSILFTGNGDFIAQQFALNAASGELITISTTKPFYTDVWNRFEMNAPFSALKGILEIANANTSGEIIFFPVTDLHLYLPGKEDYDISPEKLEVLITAIRDIERMNGWKENRIIILGDKEQKSKIQTESRVNALEYTLEFVSLETIQKRFSNIVVLDPSDLVSEELMKRYPNHRFLFRSSIKGSQVYKKRFYSRLEAFGYEGGDKVVDTITVGYDLFEEQIECESRKRIMENYLPVVLSREVYDAILRQNISEDKFIYVPDLVIAKLKEMAASQ